mmetsp:Transcript_34096/g.106751  ORF Transcript_34096/g.106751 Transcript_34096/m.106751 type:complete len:84 (+) Transcript_34096:224-475(+)
MHGKGRFTYASGNVYEGLWFEDVPHGVGKFTEGDVVQVIEHNMGKEVRREVKKQPQEEQRDWLSSLFSCSSMHRSYSLCTWKG